MKAITALVGAACALFASASTAQERLPVRDARQLMLSALDAPDGKAHGVLVGEVADAISKRFSATTPTGVSPHLSDGTPTTAASSTAGWVTISASRSDG